MGLARVWIHRNSMKSAFVDYPLMRSIHRPLARRNVCERRVRMYITRTPSVCWASSSPTGSQIDCVYPRTLSLIRSNPSFSFVIFVIWIFSGVMMSAEPSMGLITWDLIWMLSVWLNEYTVFTKTLSDTNWRKKIEYGRVVLEGLFNGSVKFNVHSICLNRLPFANLLGVYLIFVSLFPIYCAF